MTKTAKTLACSSAGSSLIELAVTLTVLVILLMGIADYGLYTYAGIEAANAAHAGAMYGAQNEITACDNSGMIAAAKADAPDIVGITATASGNNSSCRPSALCTCVANPQTSTIAPTLSSCSTIVCTSPSRVVQYVKVNTTATVNAFFNFPGLPSTLTLKGQSIMRVEQ